MVKLVKGVYHVGRDGTHRIYKTVRAPERYYYCISNKRHYISPVEIDKSILPYITSQSTKTTKER